VGAMELLSGSQLYSCKSSIPHIGTVHYWKKVPSCW